MTTPTGTISLNDVNIELSKSPTALITLNDADVRTLAEILSGTISMNDLRGKSSLNTSLWSWGDNSAGQLGDNTRTNRSSPVSVVGGFTDWVQVVGGGREHGAAVRNNGTAWAWGINTKGQSGDNTTINRSSPVSVVGGFTDWKQISAGDKITAAVRNNGTAWCWGENNYSGYYGSYDYGCLGDNTSINRSSPVSVVGGFTDWKQISAGDRITAAVRNNGTVWIWGYNLLGLGEGSVNKSSPAQVVGGITDWKQVSAGSGGFAAVRNNGTAWGWGVGLLGTGASSDSFDSPVSVIGGFTDWKQISVKGFALTAAVRNNGTAWCWGQNHVGQLGDNTRTTRSSPVSVVGGFTDWTQISVGSGTMAAIRTNGTAWCWGTNHVGQLGDNTRTNRSSPVSVVGGFTDWKMIDVGSTGSMWAIRGTGI